MSLVTKKAPDFTIEAVVGDGDFKTISLSDYKGKYVVLFFYPADFTFICPTEIQEFSRRNEDFKAANCVILGASTDSKHSHKAWIKNGLGALNHPLIADFNKTIARDYEALLDNGMALRATIIIDPNGGVQPAREPAPPEAPDVHRSRGARRSDASRRDLRRRRGRPGRAPRARVRH